MALGLVGRKAGMTRWFSDDGAACAVTVVELQPNRVVALKSAERDGYSAMQLTTGAARRPSKVRGGHFQAHGAEAGRGLWEFRLEDVDGVETLESGRELDAGLFAAGQKVDVTGRARGKGFQGGIRRWNFSRQDATHGNSLSHRSNGSIGQCQTPGRVWKGKKMSGHMGAHRVTVRGLEIVEVDADNGLLLIKGAVPGPNGADLLIAFPPGRPASLPADDAQSEEDQSAGASQEEVKAETEAKEVKEAQAKEAKETPQSEEVKDAPQAASAEAEASEEKAEEKSEAKSASEESTETEAKDDEKTAEEKTEEKAEAKDEAKTEEKAEAKAADEENTAGETKAEEKTEAKADDKKAEKKAKTEKDEAEAPVEDDGKKE